MMQLSCIVGLLLGVALLVTAFAVMCWLVDKKVKM